MLKKFVLLVAVLLIVAWFGSSYYAIHIEKSFNKTRLVKPYKTSKVAEKLHAKMLVADLHADPLLWARDLSKEWQSGHFDLPRMEQANLALQVFGVVTQSPKQQNFERNKASDRLTPLFIAQHAPPKAWFSPLGRALYQAERLQDLADNSDGKLHFIQSNSDLVNWQRAWQQDSTIKAGLLGLEGAHALEADLSNLAKLHTAGVRMIGMAHFFDNHFSGSAHGIKKGGLSEDGKALVKQAQALGITIDLAHVSPRGIDDILAISTKPLVVSHTGVKATCNTPRNLSDKHIKQIAAGGGLIGIAIFKGATCGNNIDAMLNSIDHVAKLVSVEYLALGLDLDGAVTSPMDVSGMALITDGLIKRGYSESEIAKISGLNLMRVLQQNLK